MYGQTLVVILEEGAAYGTWECAGLRGTIWRVTDGFTADSLSVISTGKASPQATPEAAARAAYRRQVALASDLDGLVRKHRIEYPAVEVVVYAVDPNDPRAEFEGKPDAARRYTNLRPWEREAMSAARTHSRLGIMVKCGEAVTLFAVAGQHVTIIRTENGVETGRWQILDGCRKVPLFLE